MAALAGLSLGCGGGNPAAVAPHAPAPEAPAPPFRNHQPQVRYVGRDACRDCHRDIYASFVRTGMGRSFHDMGSEVAGESFAGDRTLELASVEVTYRMLEEDGRYFQRQLVLDSAGRELAADQRELRYAVGSNNHNRAFLHEVDGRLYQAPVCWYPQVSRWEVCPGYEHKNDNFSRETSGSCMFCHNGRMTVVAGERNKFDEPFPRGIGCERCHGPGALHLERWSAGAPGGPDGEERDPTIVQPRRLPSAERLHVCAQCHLGDAKQTERVKRDGRELADFRPGQRLTDYVVPFRFAVPSQADFGLSSQVDRMVLSACYFRSAGRFDCLTCHDPHVSIYASSRPADHFKRKCLTCHAQEDCAGETHRRAATAGLADDCVSCHMRKAEPDDQRFTEFTDHWVRRSVDVEHEPRRDFTIEPTFPAVLATLDPGEQAFLWARAHYLFGDKTPQARDAFFAAAEAKFVEAIDAGFDRPDALYFLGKVYLLRGKVDDARRAFEAVLARQPTHHDGNFAYGQLLSLTGDPGAAEAIFRTMLERDPGDTMALAELGRILFAGGRPDDALRAYREATRIDPLNPQLWLNLGMTYAGSGRMEDAAEVGRRLAGLEPDSGSTWTFLHNVMRETGREREARESLERARRFGEP